MPEIHEETEGHVERRVVVERVHGGSSRQNVAVIVIITVIAIALVAFILTRM